MLPVIAPSSETPANKRRGAEIAAQMGLAVVHVTHNAPEHNLGLVNSVCRFLQNQPPTAALCARDCGAQAPPHAPTKGEPHLCHAGFTLVRVAVTSDETYLGGRAWTTRRAYQQLTERLRHGDLAETATPEVLQQGLWASAAQVAQCGAKLQQAVGHDASTTARPASTDDTRPRHAEAGIEPDTPEVVPDNAPLSVSLTPATARRRSQDVVLTVEPQDFSLTTREPLSQAPTTETDTFTVACRAALRILVGAYALESAVLWWRQTDAWHSGCAINPPETVALLCAPDDARLLAATEAQTSVPLRRAGEGWDIAQLNGTRPAAELFPLAVGAEIKAALSVHCAGGWDAATRRGLARYVRELALPLEVLRLQQEAAQNARRAGYVEHFAERLTATNSESNGTDSYLALLRQAAELLRARRASLMVYEADEESLAIKAGLGLPSGVAEEVRVRAGEGVAGRVWDTGQPVLATDEPFSERYRAPSFLSYPIKINGQPVGVLNVTERADGSPYDAADVRLLDIIAPQLGLALDRASWREKALQFQRMSITDPLTGLANRRYLMARLAEEVSRAERHHYPVCFVMVDLDYFKQYNDTHGHQAGDEALILLAQCLRSGLRAVDIAARYGGEEFSILLPQTTLREGLAIAERLRQAVAATVFPHDATQPQGRVTISLGVAEYGPECTTPESIIRAADQALYRAKNLGRNQVNG